jgi:P27 family predicted phage terminase small subunit
MGERGPLRKPTALKLLEGNPGKRALNLADGVNPRIEVPPAPRHLGKEAAKEWKRITPHLEELGLISAIDRAALALYCQTYGRLAELEEAFKGMVEKLVADGKDYAEAVYEVSRTKTPSGYEQQSVIVQLISSHRLQVHRHLMHFGLSPAARARVQPSNYLQPELPGFEPAPQQPTGFARFAANA